MSVIDSGTLGAGKAFRDQLRVFGTDQVSFGKIAKRGVDIFVSAVVLIILLPVFLVIAIWIKFGSKGPVFFQQHRHGLHGKPFKMFKFRTMHAGESEFVQCQTEDSRVTKTGRFLRRTSLDELPQLANVLLGDMSLVGPRPHAVEHDRQLIQSVPHFMMRYSAKPGITGLAQVKGLRGLIDSQKAIEDRLAADLEYASKISLTLDVLILLRTVPVVLSTINAH